MNLTFLFCIIYRVEKWNWFNEMKKDNWIVFYNNGVAWSISCNVDIGGSNEIWRYHRSELRLSQSDSKFSHQGQQENVCYVLCQIHLANGVRLLSNCCAWFLTEPTMYGARSISCNVDIGGQMRCVSIQKVWTWSEPRPSQSDSKYSQFAGVEGGTAFNGTVPMVCTVVILVTNQKVVTHMQYTVLHSLQPEETKVTTM